MPVEVHVFLDDDLHERLRRAMFEHHRTKAAVIREAVRRELDRLEEVAQKAKNRKTGGRR
jgi:predicted transcriptional regulator